MIEKYKEINGFGNYFINEDGFIIKNNYKSRDKKNNKMININPFEKENGYLSVGLYSKKDKISYKRYVHRLVAQAFIPNPNNYPCVNHKDGNKENNNVSNLEWVTYSQNMEHAIKNKLYNFKYGEENPQSKKYVELDINYNYIRSFIGSREENKKLGYTKDTIQRCARGVTISTKNKIYLLEEEYFKDDIKKTQQIHLEKYKKHLEHRKILLK